MRLIFYSVIIFLSLIIFFFYISLDFNYLYECGMLNCIKLSHRPAKYVHRSPDNVRSLILDVWSTVVGLCYVIVIRLYLFFFNNLIFLCFNIPYLEIVAIVSTLHHYIEIAFHCILVMKVRFLFFKKMFVSHTILIFLWVLDTLKLSYPNGQVSCHRSVSNCCRNL